MKPSRMFQALVAGLALAGCGGGGGGDGGGNDTPLATISQQNAVPVAQTAVGAVSVVTGAGDFGEALLSDGGAAPKGSASMLWGAVRAARRAARSAAAVQGPITEPCDSGTGTLTMTWDDRDSNMELSPGDRVSAVAAGCLLDDPIEPMTLDGSLSIQVVSVSPPYGSSLGLNFQPLKVTGAGGGIVTVRGTMTVSSSSGDGVVFSSGVSGKSLSVAVTGQGEDFSGSLRDFDVTTVINRTTGGYSISGSGMASSSDLNGAFIQWDTGVSVASLAGTEGSAPTSGVLYVSGKGPATLTVAAMGGGSVELRLDGNGDGAVDQTIPSTWDELGF